MEYCLPLFSRIVKLKGETTFPGNVFLCDGKKTFWPCCRCVMTLAIRRNAIYPPSNCPRLRYFVAGFYPIASRLLSNTFKLHWKHVIDLFDIIFLRKQIGCYANQISSILSSLYTTVQDNQSRLNDRLLLDSSKKIRFESIFSVLLN